MGAQERREAIANGTLIPRNRPGPPSKYRSDFHPIDLVEKMAKGFLDVEIYASWDIAACTFGKWKNENPEFQEAFARGFAKCEAFYLGKCRECWEKGDDKGFKYFIAIMNNKFGWGRDENRGTTNNIQIGNVNVLSTKTDGELLEILNQKLQVLRIEPQALIEGEVLKKDS